MSTSGSSKTPLIMIHQSKIAGTDKGRHVVYAEFKQAKYPFKWRKYVCTSCGALLGEHLASRAKADNRTGIREEDLPPCKRLMLRYKRDQKALATATTAASEKDKEDGVLEEGEISWSPGATITKGKRAPRRKRAHAP